MRLINEVEKFKYLKTIIERMGELWGMQLAELDMTE